jgi:hypothetical protein
VGTEVEVGLLLGLLVTVAGGKVGDATEVEAVVGVEATVVAVNCGVGVGGTVVG